MSFALVAYSGGIFGHVLGPFATREEAEKRAINIVSDGKVKSFYTVSDDKNMLIEKWMIFECVAELCIEWKWIPPIEQAQQQDGAEQ